MPPARFCMPPRQRILPKRREPKHSFFSSKWTGCCRKTFSCSFSLLILIPFSNKQGSFYSPSNFSPMTEAFLHYLWKYRLFSKDNLFTTEGERVQILHPGRHNTDAGPDFLDARIKIGETLWAGHVELHFKSSAWNSHGHSADKTYDNVVLHVVYENDKEIPGNKSGMLPALELKGRFDVRLWENYQDLVSSLQWISCSQRLEEVPSLTVTAWLDTLLLERLHSKTEMVARLLDENGNDWEESFYQRL